MLLFFLTVTCSSTTALLSPGIAISAGRPARLATSMCTPGAVEVYTTLGCRYCIKAKAFLRKEGISYSENFADLSTYSRSEHFEILAYILSLVGHRPPREPVARALRFRAGRVATQEDSADRPSFFLVEALAYFAYDVSHAGQLRVHEFRALRSRAR